MDISMMMASELQHANQQHANQQHANTEDDQTGVQDRVQELHMLVLDENRAKFDPFFAHLSLDKIPKSIPGMVFRFCSYMNTRILSNFWGCSEPGCPESGFMVRGLRFNSSEAAFQFLLRSADHSQAALDRWREMEVSCSCLLARDLTIFYRLLKTEHLVTCVIHRQTPPRSSAPAT